MLLLGQSADRSNIPGIRCYISMASCSQPWGNYCRVLVEGRIYSEVLREILEISISNSFPWVAAKLSNVESSPHVDKYDCVMEADSSWHRHSGLKQHSSNSEVLLSSWESWGHNSRFLTITETQLMETLVLSHSVQENEFILSEREYETLVRRKGLSN